jgi:uncharacterized membrane protein
MKAKTYLKIFLFTLTLVTLFAIISEAYNEYAGMMDNGAGREYRFSVEPMFLLIAFLVSLVCSLVAWKFIARTSKPNEKKNTRAVSLSLLLVLVYFVVLFVFKASSPVDYNYSYLQFCAQVFLLFAGGIINYQILISSYRKQLQKNTDTDN